MPGVHRANGTVTIRVGGPVHCGLTVFIDGSRPDQSRSVVEGDGPSGHAGVHGGRQRDLLADLGVRNFRERGGGGNVIRICGRHADARRSIGGVDPGPSGEVGVDGAIARRLRDPVDARGAVCTNGRGADLRAVITEHDCAAGFSRGNCRGQLRDLADLRAGGCAHRHGGIDVGLRDGHCPHRGR